MTIKTTKAFREWVIDHYGLSCKEDELNEVMVTVEWHGWQACQAQNDALFGEVAELLKDMMVAHDMSHGDVVDVCYWNEETEKIYRKIRKKLNAAIGGEGS